MKWSANDQVRFNAFLEKSAIRKLIWHDDGMRADITIQNGDIHTVPCRLIKKSKTSSFRKAMMNQ